MVSSGFGAMATGGFVRALNAGIAMVVYHRGRDWAEQRGGARFHGCRGQLAEVEVTVTTKKRPRY